MGNKKAIKQRKLSWYMKAPIRFLSKARDLYVNGMNRCSPHFNSIDTTFGCPAAHPLVLPRSFSVGSAASESASDDYRELVRANTVPYRHRAGLDLSPQKQTSPSQAPAKASKMAVPRSRSVGIGRIDEDKPCEFEDDLKTKPSIHGRSRSHAVRRSAGVFSQELIIPSNVRS
ncbi:uncharacterized protein LOC129312189 [Prosopis cineraria]|uniref:uncharacterized protein LOC129312189 n=1 Tax=Prosopis cineraria TaxID=364024 RepID=UPI002410163B|nr:uncharacterized protein LOC129312189 [Prosopis cineraria]